MKKQLVEQKLKQLIRNILKESTNVKFKFSQTDDGPSAGDIVIEPMNGAFRVKIQPNKILANVSTDKEAFDVARKALDTNPRASVFYVGESGNRWIAD